MSTENITVNNSGLSKNRNKINFPKLNLKIKIIALSVILIALPLTLILLNQVQNLQKEASENVLAVAQNNPFEDISPEDPVPFTDIQTASKIFNASISALESQTSLAATTTKPNIVVIMLDDVNPVDGRFWTSTRTPAIYNNIISKGINFSEFYGETSLCCPGRVGFLTGQHTQNHGVGDLNGTKFKPGTTIATELQSKGYYTMLTGKYVNFFDAIPKSKAIPPGWTKFDAMYTQQGRYYRYDWITKKSGTAGTTVYYGDSPSDYSTDVITRTAVKRLKEAPASKPIFAYLAPYAIHHPRTVASRYVNDPRCANIQPWKAPHVYEQDVSDKSNYFSDLKNGNINNGYSLKRNCEVLLAVDDLVKHVKNELARQGRLNNTLFILTADNGYGFGEHRLLSKTAPHTTHIPMYVAWPDGRGTTPTINSTVLSNIDLAPTLCELAGCVMGPYPNGQSKSDGVSFLSLLKNQPKNFTRYSILESQPVIPLGTDSYTRPLWWAIRTTEQHPLGLWHYIEYATGEKELYDMSNGPCYNWTPDKGGDPCELNNILKRGAILTAGQESIVAQLKSELASLKLQKGFVSPTPTSSISATPTNGQ